ncbi:toxin-antitoxin system YwqK family antitoxin [Pedobacter montanisoli]|uniref:Toxin-antitoxin system YwqK family antitoxin n=1 Tax=Pedobacter montanisoli TaxID=2923277 RepID=A0ABS9ZYU6_9SPHI|nr:hypothetical protein [Pedobacter montanisoli]MCJ0743476.1 hypothetical protein [Pedobacter montanisoli]
MKIRTVGLLFALIINAFCVFAQVKPVYFRGATIVTNPDLANSYAVFGPLKNSEIWIMKKYDMYDNLIATGSYLGGSFEIPHGEFNYYIDLETFNEANQTDFKLKDRERFLFQRGSFVNGVEEGQWLNFYPDGKIMGKSFYKNGELDGPFIQLDKNSRVLVKGTYKNGKREGSWIFIREKLRITYAADSITSKIKLNKAQIEQLREEY